MDENLPNELKDKKDYLVSSFLGILKILDKYFILIVDEISSITYMENTEIYQINTVNFYPFDVFKMFLIILIICFISIILN